MHHTTTACPCPRHTTVRPIANVYVVVTADSLDPVFAFERQEDAEAFAATFGDLEATDYGETPIIGAETAAEMITARTYCAECDHFGDEEDGCDCPALAR